MEYEFFGNKFTFPEGTDQKDIDELVSLYNELNKTEEEQLRDAGRESFDNEGISEKSFDEDDLRKDPQWIEASAEIFRMNNGGQPFEGTDEDLANYGLDMMGEFNYNIPDMVLDASAIAKADAYQKQAFLYLMETYDEKEITWEGAGRAIRNLATDPTTYVGLSTLGVGFLGKGAASQGGKVALKTMLKESLGRTGIVAGVEGALYTGIDNSARQSVKISAEEQDEFSFKELGKESTVGFVAGATIGTALDVGVTKLMSKFKKDAPEEKPKDDLVVSEDETKLFTPEDAVAPEEVVETSNVRDLINPSVDYDRASGTAKEAVTGELIEAVDIHDLDIFTSESGIPYQPKTLSEEASKALGLAKELRNMNGLQLEDILLQAGEAGLTPNEIAKLANAAGQAKKATREYEIFLASRTRTGANVEYNERLNELIFEAEETFQALKNIESAISSNAGYVLRQVQEFNKYDDVIDFSDLSEVEPDDLRTALLKASEEIKKDRKRFEEDQAVKAEIQEARDAGDVIKENSLRLQNEIKYNAALSEELGKSSSVTRKLVEASISNVFSVTTIMVNLTASSLKIGLGPMKDAFFKNPFHRKARIEAAASYSAMVNAQKAAWKAAWTSYKYEKAISLQENSKFLEDGIAIQGKVGGAIRFFPRVVQASDEYLSRIAYDSYVAAKAAGEAYDKGMKQGLSDSELKSLIDESVKSGIGDAYTPYSLTEDAGILLEKGRSLGLKGEELAEWTAKEWETSKDTLLKANDEEIANDVRDALYKRQFSGDNALSKGAQTYENWVAGTPAIRLLGQLFFRTPVRVFEEGIRMTPGVQVIAPNFMSDLAGKNGQKAQIRAQSEAMIGMGFTATALSLYANGAITGDGAYEHWKQQKTQTDAGKAEPYTITFRDGSTFNYRNFDPMSTPLKIIVNALHRMEDLETRKAQGEFIGKPEEDKIMAAISVATGAITMAVRDANLLAGVDGLIDVVQMASDAEDSDSAAIRFLGQKLKLLTPSTMSKIAKTNDPTLKDPQTFWQQIEDSLLVPATLGKYKSSSSGQYDIFGNPRLITNTGRMWFTFNPSTPEERAQGKSKETLDALAEMNYIEKQTGRYFEIKTSFPDLLGPDDLRTQYVVDKDGNETDQTLFDRYVEIYRESDPEAAVRGLLGNTPVGTRSVDGAGTRAIQEILSQLQLKAAATLAKEQADLVQKGIDRRVDTALRQSGAFDVRQ